MSEIIPAEGPHDEMKTTGIISFWLAVSALVGTFLYTIAFLVANRSGDNANRVIAQLGHAVGPYAGFVAIVTLASEFFIFVVLAIAAARWRFRIFRSPYLMISALCAALVGVWIILLCLIAIQIAIAPV